MKQNYICTKMFGDIVTVQKRRGSVQMYFKYGSDVYEFIFVVRAFINLHCNKSNKKSFEYTQVS